MGIGIGGRWPLLRLPAQQVQGVSACCGGSRGSSRNLSLLTPLGRWPGRGGLPCAGADEVVQEILQMGEWRREQRADAQIQRRRPAGERGDREGTGRDREGTERGERGDREGTERGQRGDRETPCRRPAGERGDHLALAPVHPPSVAPSHPSSPTLPGPALALVHPLSAAPSHPSSPTLPAPTGERPTLLLLRLHNKGAGRGGAQRGGGSAPRNTNRNVGASARPSSYGRALPCLPLLPACWRSQQCRLNEHLRPA